MRRFLALVALIVFWLTSLATAFTTAPTPAAPPSAGDDLKIVMHSPAGKTVSGQQIQIALLAIHESPVEAMAVLEDRLFILVRDLTTKRTHAIYPGVRSLVIVQPQRFAAMLIGTTPLPGADEIDPPHVPVEAGHDYQISVHRGEQIILQWTITITK